MDIRTHALFSLVAGPISCQYLERMTFDDIRLREAGVLISTCKTISFPDIFIEMSIMVDSRGQKEFNGYVPFFPPSYPLLVT